MEERSQDVKNWSLTPCVLFHTRALDSAGCQETRETVNYDYALVKQICIVFQLVLEEGQFKRETHREKESKREIQTHTHIHTHTHAHTHVHTHTHTD